MTHVRIKNSDINATAWVELNCTGWTEGLKRLNRTEPIIGQYETITSDGEYDIADGDQLGVENPIIPISGAIDVEEFSTNADLHATTGLTEVNIGYLKELWRVRGSSTTDIEIYFGIDNSKTLKNYDGTSDTIPVLVESVDFTPLEDSEGTHLIRFKLQLKEIKNS